MIPACLQVMGNLVMEQVLPSLEKELLPRLKAKKTEKKRVWFAVSLFLHYKCNPVKSADSL